MEVKDKIFLLAFLLIITGCSNSKNVETTEIETFNLLKKAIQTQNTQKRTIDARKLVNRTMIDASEVPIC